MAYRENYLAVCNMQHSAVPLLNELLSIDCIKSLLANISEEKVRFAKKVTDENDEKKRALVSLAQVICEKKRLDDADDVTVQYANDVFRYGQTDKNLAVYNFALKIVNKAILNTANKKADDISGRITRNGGEINHATEGFCDECSEELMRILAILSKKPRTSAVEVVEQVMGECWIKLYEHKVYKFFAKYTTKKDEKLFSDYILAICLNEILKTVVLPDREGIVGFEETNHTSIYSYAFRKKLDEFCKKQGTEGYKDLYLPQNSDIVDDVIQRLKHKAEPFQHFDGKKINRNMLLAALADEVRIVSLDAALTNDEGEEVQLDVPDDKDGIEEILANSDVLRQILNKLLGAVKGNPDKYEKYYNQCMVYLTVNVLNGVSERNLKLLKEVGWYGKTAEQFKAEIRMLCESSILTYESAGCVLFKSGDMKNYANALKSLLPEYFKKKKVVTN